MNSRRPHHLTSAAFRERLASAVTPLPTDTVWQQYTGQMLAAAMGALNPNQALCVASTTLCVDLADANPSISNATIYNIGNAVPAWGPGYAPYSSLVTSYATFLQYIQLKTITDPNVQSQLNIAATNLTAAQSNFNTVSANAVTAYGTAKTIDPNLTFSDFVQSSYPTYIAANNALLGTEAQYNNLANEVYGVGYLTIAADQNKVSAVLGGGGALDVSQQNKLNMSTLVGSVAPAGATPALPGAAPSTPASATISSFAPLFALDGSFVTKFQEWQSLATQNAENPSAAKYQATLTVNNSSQANGWSQFGWSASGGASFSIDFLDVFASGSASGSTVDVNWQSAETSMTIQFTGFASFSITPGPWFDAGAVATFYDQLRPNAPQFFGPGGSMALLPTEIIVGFEPVITLTLGAADYDNVKKAFQATGTASVQIGPFRIGSATVSTYGSSQNITYDDATSSITIGPVASTLPILLGVVCTKLGNQQ